MELPGVKRFVGHRAGKGPKVLISKDPPSKCEKLHGQIIQNERGEDVCVLVQEADGRAIEEAEVDYIEPGKAIVRAPGMRDEEIRVK